MHEQLGASLTDFAGWLMPLRYGSETAEHNAVRTAAGLFDLSHMGEFAVTGAECRRSPGLRADRRAVGAEAGPGRYTMICADDGGVLDDLIVYRLADDRVPDRRERGQRRRRRRRAHRARGWPDAAVHRPHRRLRADRHPGTAGRHDPGPLTSADLADVKYYASYPAQVAGRDVLLARTGYTGEDGFEIFAAPDDAEYLWAELSEAGASDGLIPAGLAARDTLRLEAGMPLYGNELGGRPDARSTPASAGSSSSTSPATSSAATPLPSGPPQRRPAPAGRPDHAVAPRAAARLRRPVGWRASRHRYQRRAVADARRPDRDGVRATGRRRCCLRPDQERERRTLAVDVRGRAEPATLVELPFYRRPA